MKEKPVKPMPADNQQGRVEKVNENEIVLEGEILDLSREAPAVFTVTGKRTRGIGTILALRMRDLKKEPLTHHKVRIQVEFLPNGNEIVLEGELFDESAEGDAIFTPNGGRTGDIGIFLAKRMRRLQTEPFTPYKARITVTFLP